PEARIVYVDNDVLGLGHARALLTSTPEGATAYLDADVRDPEKILAGAAETLDFTKPIAIVMLGITGNVADTDEARAIVRRLVEAVPSGSFVVINDGTKAPRDEGGELMDEAARRRKEAGDPYYLRPPAEFATFFDGLELVEPGVVSTSLWRPAPGTTPAPLHSHGGVARTPYARPPLSATCAGSGGERG
nr:SAM-dependent methyltransferase [Micromonospora sp. DSM 115978]